MATGTLWIRPAIGRLAVAAVGAALVACGGGPEPAPAPATTFECPRDKQMDDAAARRFPAEGLPSVWAVLEDREKAGCWEAGLRIAGYAATDDAFARLRGFIEHRAQRFALSGDQVVLQTAVESIGNVVRVNREAGTAQQALEFLIEGSNPETWAKRSTKWPIDAVLRRELIRLLSRASVKALAVTERPEAYATMRTLAVDAVDRRSLAFKFTAAGGKADRVEELINLHVLPPGRVAFAMEGTLSSMRGQDYTELLRLVSEEAVKAGQPAPELGGCPAGAPDGRAGEECDVLRIRVRAVRDLARTTFEMEQQWLVAARGNEQYQQAVRAADVVADSRLSGFHGQLDSLRRLVDEVEEHAAIESVSRVIFPRGPLEVIQRPHTDQVEHVLASMRVLERDYADQLAMLRLAPHVRVVVEAHEALREALLSGQQGQGYEQVLEMRARLQTRLRVLVAAIIDRVPGVTGAERRLRSLLLGTVMDHNAVVDNFLLRSEPIRDVDPETGQEIAPPEEGGEALTDAAR